MVVTTGVGAKAASARFLEVTQPEAEPKYRLFEVEASEHVQLKELGCGDGANWQIYMHFNHHNHHRVQKEHLSNFNLSKAPSIEESSKTTLAVKSTTASSTRSMEISTWPLSLSKPSTSSSSQGSFP